jgi:hypothetical protein
MVEKYAKQGLVTVRSSRMETISSIVTSAVFQNTVLVDTAVRTLNRFKGFYLCGVHPVALLTYTI